MLFFTMAEQYRMNDDPPEQEIEPLRHRPPGMDVENPYEDVDIESLPDWWQESIRMFEEYGLRPYRPPRFADGALKHKVVHELEEEFDVTIDVRGFDVTYEDDWTVLVDGASVSTVGRRRSPNGYTVFEVSSEEFEAIITAAIDET